MNVMWHTRFGAYALEEKKADCFVFRRITSQLEVLAPSDTRDTRKKRIHAIA